MGSNTFRLVVFRYRPGGGFHLVDEIRHAVRLSEGADEAGLRREALERAAHTARLYAAFCVASEVDDVVVAATSAARDAANGEEAMRALSADGALDVRVLSAEEEAWYGYLGAVNSHDPRRRQRPRPGRRLGAGHAGAGPGAAAGDLAAPRGGPHDGALPAGRAGVPLRPEAAAPQGAEGDGGRAVARRRRRADGRRGGHDPDAGADAPARDRLRAWTSCTGTFCRARGWSA